VNDFLKLLFQNKQVSVYKILPEKKVNPVRCLLSNRVKRFVFSTPYTRKILNRPEIHGFEYVAFLRKGIKLFLESPPAKKLFSNLKQDEISVLHFLRGGLNFGLLELLYTTYGFKKTRASFMTSQRFKKGKHWLIKHDQYRKFTEGKIIFAGDVIATGTTLENGFLYLLDLKVLPEKFVFFTIGTPFAEKILENFAQKLERRIKNFEAIVIYIEGRFSLVKDKKEFPFCIPGTDIVKKNALLTPEFEFSQDLSSHLERCEVYDVGARSFNWPKHFEDLLGYWGALKNSGHSVKDLFELRWEKFESFDEFKKRRKNQWKGVSEKILRRIYRKQIFLQKLAQKTDSKKFFTQRIKQIRFTM